MQEPYLIRPVASAILESLRLHDSDLMNVYIRAAHRHWHFTIVYQAVKKAETSIEIMNVC